MIDGRSQILDGEADRSLSKYDANTDNYSMRSSASTSQCVFGLISTRICQCRSHEFDPPKDLAALGEQMRYKNSKTIVQVSQHAGFSAEAGTLKSNMVGSWTLVRREHTQSAAIQVQTNSVCFV